MRHPPKEGSQSFKIPFPSRNIGRLHLLLMCRSLFQILHELHKLRLDHTKKELRVIKLNELSRKTRFRGKINDMVSGWLKRVQRRDITG